MKRHFLKALVMTCLLGALSVLPAFSFEFDAFDLQAQKGDIIAVTVTGVPNADATIVDCGFVDTRNGTFNFLGGAGGTDVKITKGKPFTHTFLISVETTPSKTAEKKINLFVESNADGFDFTSIDVTYKLSDSIPSSFSQDENGSWFEARIAPFPANQIKDNNSFTVTVTGTVPHDAYIDMIALVAERESWTDFGGAWDLNIPVKAGVPFTQTVEIHSHGKPRSKDSVNIFIKFRADKSVTDLPINNASATWGVTSEFDAKLAFVTDTEDDGVYFEGYAFAENFNGKKGKTVTITISGVPTSDATLSKVQIAKEAKDDLVVFAETETEAIQLKKGLPFTTTVTLVLPKAVKKSKDNIIVIQALSPNDSPDSLYINKCYINWIVEQ